MPSKLHFKAKVDEYGSVVQLVRTPPCHGGGRGFESLPSRLYLVGVMDNTQRYGRCNRGSSPLWGVPNEKHIQQFFVYICLENKGSWVRVPPIYCNRCIVAQLVEFKRCFV